MSELTWWGNVSAATCAKQCLSWFRPSLNSLCFWMTMMSSKKEQGRLLVRDCCPCDDACCAQQCDCAGSLMSIALNNVTTRSTPRGAPRGLLLTSFFIHGVLTNLDTRWTFGSQQSNMQTDVSIAGESFWHLSSGSVVIWMFHSVDCGMFNDDAVRSQCRDADGIVPSNM